MCISHINLVGFHELFYSYITINENTNKIIFNTFRMPNMTIGFVRPGKEVDEFLKQVLEEFKCGLETLL